MKLGTRYVGNEERAIVLGNDGQAQDLAAVSAAGGMGSVQSIKGLVEVSGVDNDVLSAIYTNATPGIELDLIDWTPPLPNPSMILNAALTIGNSCEKRIGIRACPVSP